ncbi:enniatin synthase [Lecanosticta acicola]|uniref:Enniatin synthase n=1 Tax=Lecanosticta acicola TaxID=111012 RepID=A0AAI8Z6S3_9PEZI|nr:enniatin synthase [Lecanosticta acicola]
MHSRNESLAAFSLLADSDQSDVDALCCAVAKQCRVESSQIQDILPCSPFQRHVVNRAANDPQIGIGQTCLEVSEQIDSERLFAAWSDVVRLTPALRSRTFTAPSGNHLQVTLSENISWKSVTSPLGEVQAEERASAAVPGAQCNRYVLVSNPNAHQRTLVWTFSYAFVDNAFQNQLIRNVLAVHDGEQSQTSPGMKELLRQIATLQGVSESAWPQESNVEDLMREILAQDAAMHRFEQAGLNDMGPRTRTTDATIVPSQTVLAVTSFEDGQERNNRLRRAVSGDHTFVPYTDRALLLECQVSDGSMTLFAQYDPNVMDETGLRRFLRQLGCMIDQFRGGDLPVRDLDAMTEEDQDDIRKWNSTPPTTSLDCIHDLIARWAVLSPQNPAVCAWDGDLKYGELDDASSRLALHIESFNLEAECVIPLCFEKSKWTIISMLAVLKAGAAFTLIDPSVPLGRIEGICQQISPQLALVSEDQRQTMDSLARRCIAVNQDLLHSLPPAKPGSHAVSKAQDLAYIIFTSGSTGEPKGTMVEHRGLTSYAPAFGPAFKMDQNTRTLQFASYAYAVCLAEMFGALFTGGCLCIPSENDRVNDIASFIRSSKANFAAFTPSFVGSIQPEHVPSLEVLMLAGEPMTPETKNSWAGHAQLLNACGQSECLLSSICTIDADTPDVRVIGRGSGTRLWIIEPSNSDRLAPVGCPGELMIESGGVARGYLHLPEAGASKFYAKAPLWYSGLCEPRDSVKFYRTGDMACYQSDGSVLHLGRSDLQVKIRGQRVELGDVECNFRKILPPDVTPVVEIVKRAPHREVLVAFLVGPLNTGSSCMPTDSEAFTVDDATASRFNGQMGTQVGRHAIPSYYVCLKKLPTTATGKTDRKKLRAIGHELLEDREQDALKKPEEPLPDDGPELAMAHLWAQNMPVNADSIGLRDNFFDLGGDSIVAIRIVNKARASGMPLKVADILQNPVLSDLVAVAKQESTQPNEEEAIPVQPRDSNEAELSFSQRGLWFLEQLNPGTPAYNVSIAGRLRGILHINALQAALQAVEKRHETLRTTFSERNGVPVQVIQPCRPIEDTLQLIDIATDVDLQEELHRQQVTAFDLRSRPPWRVALLRISSEEHVLSIVMHHIISDGWSDDILRRDLAAFYSAAIADRDVLTQLEPLPIYYRDFAAWQQHAEQQAEQQSQLQYWTKQLAENTPAELLIDKPRPALPSGKAGMVGAIVEGPLYKSLQEFCKLRQTTPFVVLLAAFRAAHYRLTGAEDATIGTPNASCNRSELEDLVGFFSNTQCIRIKLEGETFGELVQQVKASVTAALAHQDVPFERIVSEVLPGSRDASRNPLVQLMFAVHSQPNLGEIHLEGLVGEALPGTASTRFDLEFHLVQRAEEIQGQVLFAEELFEPETIHATVRTFIEILRRGLQEPDVPVSSLPLTDGLAELRSRSLLDTPQTSYPRDSSIVDVFSEQVAAHPHATAVKDSSTEMTYTDLDHKSDMLATWLRRRGFAAEAWIGVLASRSCQAIVAFIGILKANLVYVPLDVDAPHNRIEGILSSFPARKLVLLDADVRAPEVSTNDGIEFVHIAETLEQVDQGVIPAADTRPSATSLAYVMFTSGSTGKPKGVAIEHRGVVRLVKQTNVLSQLPSGLKVSHLFNIAFDLSVWEIYTALLNGGCLVCIDSATKTDTQALAQMFAREQIQASMMPPVLLKACLASSAEILKGLSAFYNGADRFDSHDAALTRKLMSGRVVNAYGPTENSALSTIFDVQAGDSLINGVPIGEAISNSGAYVMDANQRPISSGVMGELVVTGDGVARGYTDPSLNQDRFVEVEVDNKRMKAYRTGDRVRYRPKDGQIEFFGRLDRQIKIRGFRIEMAEIEHAMLKHDEVDDAVVVINQRESEDINADLIGFITTQDDTTASREEHTSNQVESWGQQFDNNFYEGIEDIDRSILGSDFLGWTSMYDGSKIDRSEMQEWLEDTMRTMLDGQAAGRVLEIGSGTGMVLFNLGDRLENYVGIDPSEQAVKFATEKMKEIPGLAEKVQIHVGTAADISRIDTNRSELVVLNSVVQYFPSPEYLLEVVETIARLGSVRRIFFGDVRSYSLNRQFLLTRALYKLGEKASKTSLQREMARMEDREEELLVDPIFFTGLRDRMSDLIEHVEILPKMMEATNELSAYRYAAIVHVKRPSEPVREVHGVRQDDWVDFSARQMDRNALGRLLEDCGNASLVAVGNIPYGKTILERHILSALEEEEEPDANGQLGWLSMAKDSADRCPSMSAAELVELGRQAGFHTEVSWARQSSQKGGLDAIFHRYTPSAEGVRHEGRRFFRFPSDSDGSTVGEALSNRPLQGLRNLQVERRVRNALQIQLPSYMVPQRITVLDRMPTNANGKVDRKQLARLAERAAVIHTTASRVPPQNEEERALCEEFSNVLGVDVNPTDDFFALGGHSLMAMRLLPRVSDRLGWHILLRDLYQKSTPRALYTAARDDANGKIESEWPSFMEAHSRGSKSRATLVLVHGFWGQGRIFVGLLPVLNEHLDVIILHDPFFGKAEGPRSLDEWADFYLEALRSRLPRDRQVILGGYSFGSFTALKMASLWKEKYGVDLQSLILLDPAVWEAVNVDELSKGFIDEKVNYGLRLFGGEQRDFVMKHFEKFGPLMNSPREKPEYGGRGLHIASSEVAQQGVPKWWAANYPRLEQRCIDATHHGLFEWATAVKEVGKAINEHCERIWQGM